MTMTNHDNKDDDNAHHLLPFSCAPITMIKMITTITMMMMMMMMILTTMTLTMIKEGKYFGGRVGQLSLVLMQVRLSIIGEMRKI